MTKPSAVILLSGGIDSTTALILADAMGYDVTALIFDYGQRLQIEVNVARENAERYLGHKNYAVVDAPMNWIDPNCSLLGPRALQTGRDARDIALGGPPTSYVPFRNGIFFAYAAAYAEPRRIETIIAGCNGLLSGNYSDDTQAFGHAMQAAIREGTQPGWKPSIWLPFTEVPKRQIVALGLRLGVDYRNTWSCYDNGPAHCGRCDSCVQRRAAFAPNGLDLEGNPIS